MVKTGYEGKLKTQLYWHLHRNRPFFIGNEYKVELLYINKENLTAKILITKLQDGEQVEQDIEVGSLDQE